jgi:hypothetical protein
MMPTIVSGYWAAISRRIGWTRAIPGGAGVKERAGSSRTAISNRFRVALQLADRKRLKGLLNMVNSFQLI